ncbi:MAG: DUF938 domain-containing protein [Hyphomicrobiaceae bacterium]
MSQDHRRYAPAAARNRDAIREVLCRVLPTRGLVLEIASGSGEHVTHIAAACGPDLIFQPSDPEPAARASIDAWRATLGLTNVRPAMALDAAAPEWPLSHADAVLCINMIHIAPWSATVGLVQGAARILAPVSLAAPSAAHPQPASLAAPSAAHPQPAQGLLYLYGPFRRQGHHTAPSNERFDADLRQQNPLWGVRDLEAVAALAAAAGFAPPQIEPMPANNLSLLFYRS